MNSDQRLYTPQFFQVLTGAMLTMTGVAMQFHFGEYIAHIGYQVDVLGWITGIGVVGSLLLRPYAGTWIDRLGCRPCFIASALGAATANFLFQFVDTLWLVCLLRILMAASNATFLATVATYAAQVAPAHRRAESLGTVGVGGFLGMMTGPAIGDVIFANPHHGARTFAIFFTTVAALSLASGVVLANVRLPAPVRHVHHPPLSMLLRRHWPGRVLLICITFAVCINIHMVFLERFAEHRGFGDIGWFFLVYAPTAIVLRIVGRRIPQKFGRRRVCATGVCCLGAGLLLLLPVQAAWHLIFAAFVMGMGHALAFPSMVDLVAQALPIEHRGVGTSLALGAMDVGFLLASIVWGQLIEWKGFSLTFTVGALMAVGVALWYWHGAGALRKDRISRPQTLHDG